jgi:hypothetical protein
LARQATRREVDLDGASANFETVGLEGAGSSSAQFLEALIDEFLLRRGGRDDQEGLGLEVGAAGFGGKGGLGLVHDDTV